VELHLIHAKKHGTTEMLSTTKKFPEYFGIDSTNPEEIREFLAKKVIQTTQKKAMVPQG
jgi:chromosome segregation and condensation protein ScpB